MDGFRHIQPDNATLSTSKLGHNLANLVHPRGAVGEKLEASDPQLRVGRPPRWVERAGPRERGCRGRADTQRETLRWFEASGDFLYAASERDPKGSAETDR